MSESKKSPVDRVVKVGTETAKGATAGALVAGEVGAGMGALLSREQGGGEQERSH